MIVEQFYTQCLSEAAYIIASNGEAAVVDPLRDIDVYIAWAEQNKVKIKYIFETHFHADFVSGHLDLAAKTGAQIIFGPHAHTHYSKHEAQDGELFTVGACTLRIIHTPGHTLESTCFLLYDPQGIPHALFTGDTLFVGDVGRPDLSGGHYTTEELAAMLYDSLQKLNTLPDHVIVYPAHGAGSSCGKQLGPERHSTLGHERAYNYALQSPDKLHFIQTVTEGLSEPPVYFSTNARINKQGYESIDQLKENGLVALQVHDIKYWQQQQAILLDTRPATIFTQGFIPGSVSIGLEGRFAEWAGTLLPFHENIVMITEPGKEEETLIRLTRVGFDRVVGYLQGGYEAWVQAGEPIDMIIDIEADELQMDLNYDEHLVVVDVRKELEFDAGHVQTAVNMPLHTLIDLMNISSFEEDDNIYIHCAGGYRSVIAASLFKRQGVHNIRNVLGGYDQIKQLKGMPLVAAKELLN